MAKRSRSLSRDRSGSQVPKKKYRPTNNKNKNDKPKKSNKGNKSKKVKAANEFQNTTTFEEMKHVKFLGMTKKTNKPFTQEWQKEGDKVKLTQPKVFEKFVEVELPTKQTLSGRKIDAEPSFDSDDDCHNQGFQLRNKKKKKKPTKTKATYDKAPEDLPSSQGTQDKDSGIDESEASSASGPVQQPPRPVKCVDVSAWDALHVPEPIKKILSELGFSKPTEIQKLTIGEAIKTNCDILGAAETGSGKTLAFGIPIIAGLARDAERRRKQAEEKEITEQQKAKTALSKKQRAEARQSDGDTSSEESAAESDEYEEAEESEGEEYLFNGPDGILEVDYSELDNGRKEKKKKKKAKQDSDTESEDGDSESDLDMEEGDDDSDLDMEEGENDSDLDMEEGENDSDLDMEEGDDETDSEEDESFDEEEIGSDDEEIKGRALEEGAESDKGHDLENGHSNSESEGNSDNEDEFDGERDDSDGDDEQSQSDVDQDDSDVDQDDSADTDNSDSDDDDDLGSSEEEDVDSDGDDGQKMGCIRAINNVVFPFATSDRDQRFKDGGEKQLLRALILTPTRELAVQVHCSLSRLCRAVGIRSCVVVGGLDSRKQRRILTRTTPELVVATPGRLWELAQDGVQHLQELRGVRYLAIDEADRMIDKKNFEEVHKLVRLMSDGLSKNKACSNRQTFVFSATLTMVHQLPDRLKVKHKSVAPTSSADKLRSLAKIVGMKPSAKILDVTRKHATAENLTECRINCELTDKDQYLYYFLKRHPGRTMVFCNSVDGVRRLRSVFDLLKCNPVDLHASMHQKQRLRNLQTFRSSPQGVIFTTDVAARGLDIPGVQHVIHFQVPFTAETYVHRSGRTARGTQSGLSVVFIEPKDLLRFRQICTTLGRTSVNEIPSFPVDENLYDQVEERVRLAVSLEKQLHKLKRDEQFKKDSKLVEEHAGIINSEDEIDQEDLKLMPAAFQREYRSGGVKGELKRIRARLDQLVDQPLLGSLFSYSHPLNRAALAAGMGTKEADIPNELVGMNPTRTICADDSEAAYQDRYAKEIYGEAPEEEVDGKTNISAVLKQQKKDLAKLTRRLIKPELTAREKTIRMKEKNKELKQKRAAKKREKRKKRKMRGGAVDK